MDALLNAIIVEPSLDESAFRDQRIDAFAANHEIIESA
jgi:hypothetical protein